LKILLAVFPVSLCGVGWETQQKDAERCRNESNKRMGIVDLLSMCEALGLISRIEVGREKEIQEI
jgi:hypothetical protein